MAGICSVVQVQILEVGPWNNGKEVPRWGVAEIQSLNNWEM